MNNNLIKNIEETIHYQKILYAMISPKIEKIINSKSTNISEIEQHLDILGGLVIDEAIILFDRLCTYYETVNPENAKAYIELKKELFDEIPSKPKIKKRDLK